MNPREFLWSSYRNYLEETPTVDWVTKEKTLCWFATKKDYIEFIESKAGQELEDPFDKAEAGFALGRMSYIQRLKKLVNDRDDGNENDVPMLQKLLRLDKSPSFELVNNLVEQVFSNLSACKRRRMLIYILHKVTLLRGAEIAKLTDRTAGSVSQTIRSVENQVRENKFLKYQVKKFDLLLAKGESPPQP